MSRRGYRNQTNADEKTHHYLTNHQIQGQTSLFSVQVQILPDRIQQASRTPLQRMLLIRPNSMRHATIRVPSRNNLSLLRIHLLPTTAHPIHLMRLSILLPKTAMLPIPRRMHLRKSLIISVHLLLVKIPLLGRRDSGIIPARIQMILVLCLAGALAAVSDVEVAAGADAQADDYEG